MPNRKGAMKLDLASASLGGVVLAGVVGLSLFGMTNGSSEQDQDAREVSLPEDQGGHSDSSDTPDRRARFIVRISGVDAIDQIIATYPKDKSKAQSLFLKWSGGRSELTGFKLDRASYSGELILIYSEREGKRPVETAQKDLLSIERVRYADLDEVVTIEEEGRP